MEKYFKGVAQEEVSFYDLKLIEAEDNLMNFRIVTQEKEAFESAYFPEAVADVPPPADLLNFIDIRSR